MADQWATVDSCDKCGRTANIEWVGITSYGSQRYTRIDVTSFNCPTGCHWGIAEVNQAYRGRHGM